MSYTPISLSGYLFRSRSGVYLLSADKPKQRRDGTFHCDYGNYDVIIEDRIPDKIKSLVSDSDKPIHVRFKFNLDFNDLKEIK